MFKSFADFFGKYWPTVKTIAITVGGAALTAAGSGAFGPKGAVAAGAISALVGLFTHKPGSEPQ